MSNLPMSFVETHVLSENKNISLDKLTPYTEDYYYVEIVNLLQSKKLSDELDKKIEIFLNNSKYNQERKSYLRLNYLTLKLENAKEEEKKDIMEKINKNFLNYDFNHQKPIVAQTDNLNDLSNEETLPDALNDNQAKKLNLKTYLDELYREMSISALNKIDIKYYQFIDIHKFDYIKNKNLVNQILDRFPKLYEINNIVDFIKEIIKSNPNFDRKTIVFNKLTLPQQDELIKLPQFRLDMEIMKNYVVKKFMLCEIDFSEDTDNTAIIKDFLDFSRQLPKKFEKFISLNLGMLLQEKLKKFEFDEDLFLEYIEKPYDINLNHYNHEYKTRLNKDFHENQLQYIDLPNYRISYNFINDYLEHLLVNKANYEKYSAYFDSKYLSNIYYKNALMRGDKIDNINDVFSEAYLQKLNSTKILDIQKNKKVFKHDERIEIKVNIKNINELNVKVFEVSTENFIKRNNNQNYQSLDLFGLIPFEEYKYTYNQPAIIKHDEVFRLLSIEDVKRGVFIVHFTGEELNSSAIIQKGHLTLINDAVTGRSCKILDEDNNVCVSSKTGIYIKGKYFSADASSGIIKLPLNLQIERRSRVMIVHEGFADMATLTIYPTDYKLNTNIIYNPESFITGNEVELLLQSKLTLNNQFVPIDRLKDTEIDIKIWNDSGVVTKIPCEDFSLSDYKDLPIKFILPNKAVSIILSLRATLKQGNDEIKLNSTQDLSFQKNDNKIDDLYIKKNENKEYLVELLGNNGEPIKKKILNVVLKPLFLTSEINFRFQTNQEGKVNLGPLRDIESIHINTESANLYHEIENKENKSYPYIIKLIEGEKYELPITAGQKSVKLMKIRNNSYIQEIKQPCIQIENDLITIKDLEDGSYELSIDNENIKIIVLKGEKKRLIGDNLIYKNHISMPNKNKKELVAQTSSTKDAINVKLHGSLQYAKAHLVTLNYDLSNKRRFLEKQKSFNKSEESLPEPEFLINRKENIYRSGARLSDEVMYVYERKNKTEFMGNTLEKPGVLLKRNKIEETLEHEEQLGQSADYKKHSAAINVHRMMDARQCEENYPMQEQCMTHNSYRKAGGSYMPDIIPKDFIENPGKLYSNLKIENNEINIDKNLLNHSSLAYLIVTDGHKNILVEIDAKDIEVQKKDIRLQESKPKGFIYSYDRKINFVPKKTEYSIKNINNTEICILSSLKNIYSIFSLVNGSLSVSLKEWDFITEWFNLSDMEKLKKYDKYACHELNLLLYLKDREFFDGVVSGFLMNKVEKQLIDYYLLNDIPSLQAYCSIENIMNMNNVEKVLLISALKDNNPKFCDALIDYMRNQSHKASIPLQKRKQTFDTILTSQKDNDAITEVNNIANPSQGGASNNIMLFGAPQQLIDKHAKLRGRHRTGGAMMKTRNIPYNAEEESEEVSDDEYDESLVMSAKEQENEDLNNDYYELSAVISDQNKQADLFTGMKSTIEYNEKQYFNHSIVPKTSVTKFWYNLALTVRNKNNFEDFFDAEFLYENINLSEALFILSFLDLPFNAQSLKSNLNGPDLNVSNEDNIVVLSKEIIQKQGEVQKLDVLVAQRFVDKKDPVIYEELEDGIREYEKEVVEYIKGNVYHSRIVVTNSTTTKLNLNILREIPQGALPVSSKDYFKIENVDISSFSTKVIEFDFYFPATGQFTVYPATVIYNDKIVTTANIPENIVVKEVKETKNMDNIGDILSSGNFDNILNFLKSKNLFNDLIFNFNQIYWLLKNKEMYFKIIDVFRDRGIFDRTVWSYSIVNNDITAFKELIAFDTKHRLNQRLENIQYMQNKIVKIDRFEIKEYYPLINPRAHIFQNNKSKILNKSFEKQYNKFLNYLFQKGDLTLNDRIVLTSYLICQERMHEAINVFKYFDSYDSNKITTKLQYDYLKAYLDFISGYPEFNVAKNTCKDYLSYPVLTWRNLFVEIANQLAEFEEKELIENLIESKEKSNIEKAKNTSNFKCDIVYNENELNSIKINYEKMDYITIKYYKVDLEVLFSLKPFEEQNSRNFCTLSPFLQETIPLACTQDFNTHLHQIPANIQNESLYIELLYVSNNNSKTEYLDYIPFKLDYNLNTEYGILRILDPIEKRPVPKIYVKCFAMYNSGAKFYKDGYTDLRGSFDYVSLNTDKLTDIKRFAILIVSKTHGCKILYCEPPIKLGRVEGEAKNLVSDQWENMRAKQMFAKNGSKNRYANVI